MKRLIRFLALGSVLALVSVAVATPPADAAQPAEHSQAVDDTHAQGAHGHEDVSHSEGAAHGAHDPHFEDINWWYGFVGEKDGVEPNLFWRRPGMPVPYGALLLNSAVLFFLLIRFGGPKISEALKERRARITHGFDEAAKMKREAEEQLSRYEERLRNVDEEIERVRTQMREAGEAERTRVLNEAKERRERMEREAVVMVEQELKAARELLFQAAVRSAISSAQDALRDQLTPSDQQRIAEEYLKSVRTAAHSLGVKA